MADITQALSSLQPDDPKSSEELLSLLYVELRKLAAYRMSREAPGHTLQPTALVHESWLRLVGTEHQTWANRAHFFGAAAEAMRRILIDRARRKLTQRQGGGRHHENIEEIEIACETEDDQLLRIDEALDKLAREDRTKADLVKLRYFVGLSFEETAEVLGVSVPTAKRRWAYARAWLFAELREKSAESPGNASHNVAPGR
jgi:RNA polymerase sigma factor (TIGR02999 family)